MRIAVLVVALLTLIPNYGIPESAAADGVTGDGRGRCTEVSNRRFLIRINCDAVDSVTIERGDFPFGVTFGAGSDADDLPRRPRRPGRGDGGGSRECHPAYGGCLPIVDDLNCEDINDRQVRVRDPENDPYGLDGSTTVGNGITCDGIG